MSTLVLIALLFFLLPFAAVIWVAVSMFFSALTYHAEYLDFDMEE
jgi:hypothetical protein